MKAAVWHGVRDIRIESVTDRELKSTQVKVKVAWAGICGSDMHAYMHDMSNTGLGPQVGKPHEISGRMAPITMGHEFSGIVTDIGSDVTKVAIGDRVTVEPIIRDDSEFTKKVYII